VAKLQKLFPLLFSSFLEEYLRLIISLLFSTSFANEKLINCIIASNTLPLTTLSYTMAKE
jgi:hypothetical protein